MAAEVVDDQQLMQTLDSVYELASTDTVGGYIAPTHYNSRFMCDNGGLRVGGNQIKVEIFGDHPDADRERALYSSKPVALGRFVRAVAIDGPESGTTAWYGVDPLVSDEYAFVAVTSNDAEKGTDLECRLSDIPASRVHAFAELLYERRAACERARYSQVKTRTTEQAPQPVARVVEVDTATAQRFLEAGRRLVQIVARDEQSA